MTNVAMPYITIDHPKGFLSTIQIILQLVGVGSIVGWLSFLIKKRRESFENRILKFFESDNEWHGPDGIVGDLYLDVALKGVPGFVMFPADLSGWAKSKALIRALPYLVRYYFQKMILLPRRARVESTLRDLWKKGLLTRAYFDPKFYRLKH
jgi:hypothetical protein